MLAAAIGYKATLAICPEDKTFMVLSPWEDYDSALLGLALGENTSAVYSMRGVLKTLIAQGMTMDDAIEYFEFNIAGAKGANFPIYLLRGDGDYAEDDNDESTNDEMLDAITQAIEMQQLEGVAVNMLPPEFESAICGYVMDTEMQVVYSREACVALLIERGQEYDTPDQYDAALRELVTGDAGAGPIFLRQA